MNWLIDFLLHQNYIFLKNNPSVVWRIFRFAGIRYSSNIKLINKNIEIFEESYEEQNRWLIENGISSCQKKRAIKCLKYHLTDFETTTSQTIVFCALIASYTILAKTIVIIPIAGFDILAPAIITMFSVERLYASYKIQIVKETIIILEALVENITMQSTRTEDTTAT